MTDKGLWGDGKSISESDNRAGLNQMFSFVVALVAFEVLIEVACLTPRTVLLMNTEKPVWEDKGQPILAHQHLLSELSVIRKKRLNSSLILQGQYYMRATCWEILEIVQGELGVYIEALLFVLFAPTVLIDPWMTLIKVCQSDIASISCDILVISSFPQGTVSIPVICIASNQWLHINCFMRATWPERNRLEGKASWLEHPDWSRRGECHNSAFEYN